MPRSIRQLCIRAGLLALAFALALQSGPFPAADAGSGDAATRGQWSATAVWPTSTVHAHLLPTGLDLFHSFRDDPRTWDPSTNRITALAPSGLDIYCSGHALLGDGRLLFAGGHVSESVGEKRAVLYDPFANAWQSLPEMNAGRWYPTGTTLPSGDVLVLSGDVRSSPWPSENNPLPQVWKAGATDWRNLDDALRELPQYPQAYLAPNGKVFVAGPDAESAYLDPAGSGAWTDVARSAFGYRHRSTSVMYADGKVLLLGGGNPATASAEVIDLNAANPAWRPTASMAFPRRSPNATLLPDGSVLVTGGVSGSSEQELPVYAAEVWNPATEAWTTLGADSTLREYHSIALLLPDGRVLTAGGNDGSSAETFSPPYLFKGPRPTITAAPTDVTYGETFKVATPDAAVITRVTWVRLSSVTHGFNSNQRINTLKFARAAGGLSVTAPTSPNLSPPGHYLLFLLNANGVPSAAKIVQVGGPGLVGPPPPTVTVPNAPLTVREATYTLRGTAESGAWVRVWRDADGDGQKDPVEPLVAQQRLARGATEFAIPVSLPANGPLALVATATDAAGHESIAADVPTITRDAQPVRVSGLAVAPPRFSPNADGTQDTTGIHYTLSEPGAVTLEIYDSRNALVRTVVAGEQRPAGPNAESWDGGSHLAGQVPNGSYTFRLRVEDAVGNRSLPASGLVAIDTVSPAAPKVPGRPITLDAATRLVSGTAEAGALVRIWPDEDDDGQKDPGQEPVALKPLPFGAVAFSVQVPLKQDAANRLVATATDAAGNESAAARLPTIVEDSTRPPAPTVTTPDGPRTVKAASATIGGQAEAGGLVQVWRDVNDNSLRDPNEPTLGSQQLAPGETTYAIVVPLPRLGAHDFLVTATDAARNQSPTADVPRITRQ